MSPGGASPRRRGDYHELRTRDDLEAHGWQVTRAAGSLGIADLIALKAGNPPLLVSCKLGGKIGPAERLQLWRVAQRAGAVPLVAWRPMRGVIGYRKLHDDLTRHEWRYEYDT